MGKNEGLMKNLGAWEKIGNLKEMTTIQVSARGDGLCLYLPKDFCELHNIIAGHRIRVWMLDHYRRRRIEDE